MGSPPTVVFKISCQSSTRRGTPSTSAPTTISIMRASSGSHAALAAGSVLGSVSAGIASRGNSVWICSLGIVSPARLYSFWMSTDPGRRTRLKPSASG